MRCRSSSIRESVPRALADTKGLVSGSVSLTGLSKLLDSYASYLGTSPSNFSQLYLKMTGRRAGRIRPTVRPRISPRISPQFTPQFAPAIRLAVRPQFPRVRPAIRPVRRVRFPMAIDTTTSERGKWWRRRTDRSLGREAMLYDRAWSRTTSGRVVRGL